ncbi:hypothetical protein UUU_34930 [Klebsiella pneumoniae subsp. pneumoniae DSM 30104 = JCM 1662 = NBRC 14940]|nr:hypothetical protein UUU_34930 [Klebsiella pneumoniae subsp. pneumoniae DSM 30104 = JCM 1662 = NBRC 14940]
MRNLSKLFTGLFVVTRLRIIYRSLSSRHRISAECLNILSIPQLYLFMRYWLPIPFNRNNYSKNHR